MAVAAAAVVGAVSAAVGAASAAVEAARPAAVARVTFQVQSRRYRYAKARCIRPQSTMMGIVHATTQNRRVRFLRWMPQIAVGMEAVILDPSWTQVTKGRSTKKVIFQPCRRGP